MSRRSKGEDGSPPGEEDKSSRTTRSYEVGFGKPPMATRFPPGTSGNPKGRPRRSENPEHELMSRPAQKILREELYRTIKMREAGKEIDVPALLAVTRAAILTAVKGSSHAQKALLQIAQQLEEDAIRRRDQMLKWALEAKWAGEETLRLCKKLGLPEDLAPIHPDDILIDMATGQVEIAGPITAEHRAVVADGIASRDAAQAMMLRAIELLEEQPDDCVLQGIRWIAQSRYDAINEALPTRLQKELQGRLPPGSIPPALPTEKQRRVSRKSTAPPDPVKE